MSEFLQHITIEGERWDKIAHDYYGSASMMNVLISANPEVPLYDIFPGNVVLNIPIVDQIEVKTGAELLPPWKR